MTIENLILSLGLSSHHVLILILCIPYLQPIPFPGLSSIFAIVIMSISFFLLLEGPPWLPEKIRNISLSQEFLFRVLATAEKIWLRIEKIVHPRMSIIFKIPGLKTFDFLIVLVSAVLLSLPLPIPFSNFIPILPIFVNSLGHLEEDGLLVLFSYILFVLNIIFFVSLGAGLFSGIEALLAKFNF